MQILEGLPAAPGSAAGKANPLIAASAAEAESVPASQRSEQERAARDALEAAAAEILEIAARLREQGRQEEAEIIETGALMARDPGLQEAVSKQVLERGKTAAGAILAAAEAMAETLAALDDPGLAERADDVRSVGRRAAGLLAAAAGGRRRDQGANGDTAILVAPDLGPAEVAELEAGVAGIALARGGVSAHAAIVARSLGIPMVVGAGEELLSVGAGDPLVVDGSAGTVYLAPDSARIEAARRETARRAQQRAHAVAARKLPSVTRDGRTVRVLANVSGSAELTAALDAGAEGVGLLRTELVFLDASGWPTVEEHRAALDPILAGLGSRVATVRVLDFGGDKTPPFLRGTEQRGIELLLRDPTALDAQLQAILAAAGEAELRVLFPMVQSPEQVSVARRAVLDAVEAVPGSRCPWIGAMIETGEGVANAAAIAARVDFLSIGTNDLTHSILEADRFASQQAPAYHPRVLRSIAEVVEAAGRCSIPVEVCGEAASDPVSAPLLIGAGVDELSVGAARVGAVRSWVRSLSFAELRRLEVTARRAPTSGHVEALVQDLSRRLSLLERADAGSEVLEGPVGVGPVRAQAQGRPALGA